MRQIINVFLQKYFAVTVSPVTWLKAQTATATLTALQ